MKNNFKKMTQQWALVLIASTASLIFSQTASAIVLSSVGQHFSVAFDGNSGGN